jgi:VanZ family protein
LKNFIKFLPAYTWALCILFLCTVDPSNLPSIKFNFVLGTDKLVHFLLFGTQALLIILPGDKTLKNYFTAFLISTVYGAFVEVVQGLFFTKRSFDFADMLANATGVVVILILVAIIIGIAKPGKNLRS